MKPLDDPPIYYDRQGQPIYDTLAWGKLFQDPDYKRVAEDTVGHLWVSTVWLGLDHSSWPILRDHGAHVPIIFETMVFAKEGEDQVGPVIDNYSRRYATEAEALEGHKEIVALVSYWADEIGT